MSTTTPSQTTTPQLEGDKPPHVLVIGAGPAGLFLGNLIERASIPYDIFERTATIKPLGAIMCLTDKMKPIAKMEAIDTKLIGYDSILFARPELYYMLFKRIPPHKTHMSRKLISFCQDKTGVKIQFADGTTAQGDVFVGADGAHSGVRQHLYKTLDSQGLLPEIDTQSMSKGYISLIGTTDLLDPAGYPGMTEPGSENIFMIGDGNTPYTLSKRPIWRTRMFGPLLTQNCDNKQMMDEIRHFKTTYGTLGDLFDTTPMERISKVYFEDKLFETWNHDGTVLIADAAHKLLPSTGAGAVNAMQDAVVLTNRLYDIKPTKFETVKTALYPQSYMSARLLYGHTYWEIVMRNVIFNYTPASIQRAQILKDSAFRPQANFLPQVPKRGAVEVTHQKPSKRLQAEEAQGVAGTALV
ncbi:hypothetical protein BGX29_011690 [Mortierella sp. GBA35]|nr:hypothetical protein BGX29_011690 [Mortierella sp. GBA35]